ncbi:hypothetical protein [Fibrobacter sp.]|uniref:hypothetical protein n=1 Tax=Fibrobacter sp. TaxID=35828 RepID=UPI00260AC9BB|nr:hypothetical protein [Fibrobacter sp.]
MNTWLFTSLPRSSFLELAIAIRLGIIPLLVGSRSFPVSILHIADVIFWFHSNNPLFFILDEIVLDAKTKIPCSLLRHKVLTAVEKIKKK